MSQKRISKDAYFMEIAEVVSKRSTCIKRHVGAVLVKDSYILSTGYNGAPSGFRHCSIETCVRQNLKSGEKPELCRGVHAEVNCVSENTLIVLDSGEIVEAKDCKNHILAVNKNLKVVSSHSKSIFSTKDNLIKIKTVGNYELLVSEDHLMFKMDNENGLEIIKACKLTLNDYLPIITFIPIIGAVQKLPTIEYDSYKLNHQGVAILRSSMRSKNISQNQLAHKLKFSRMVIERLLSGEGVRERNFAEITNMINPNLNKYKMGVDRKKIKIPTHTSDKLCQIIGYFIGDGTIGKNFLKFFDKNKQILDYYDSLIKDVFGISGSLIRNKNENQFILTVSSKRLSQFFEKLEIGIHEKKIPSLFQRVDNQSLSYLLKGFSDAEGMVRNSPRKVVVYTSGFIKILEVVRLLLLRFGILSSLYKIKRNVKISKGAGTHSYALSISGEDLLKYKKIIGFSHPLKKEKLENIEKVGLSKRRCYPKFYFTSRISTTKWPTLRDRRYNVISHSTANKIVKDFKRYSTDRKILSDLTRLTESNLSFVKIKKLDKISKSTKMIDFFVPNYNSFIANGLLVHNCIIQAAIHGTSIMGDTTIYTTHFPCMTCLKLIINAGIKRLVYREGYNMENKVKEEMVRESTLIIEKIGDNPS